MANNIAIPDSSATRTLKTTETAGVNVPHYNLDTVAAGASVDIGAVNETAPSTDTASSGLNGRLQRVAQNLTAVTGSKGAGTAAASALLAGGVYNSSAPTLTTGQQASLQLDASGNLKVTGGGGGGGGTQYAEDAAHASGDTGTVALVVRKDTATQTAGTDGDYSVLVNDANGRLHVIASSVTGTASAGTAAGSSLLTGGIYNSTPITVTNGQQAALQTDANGFLKVNVATGGTSGTQYTEDAAAASDPVGNMLIAVRRDTLSTSEVSADGDNVALKATSKGQLHVKDLDAGPATSTYRLLSSAASTNGANIKNSPGIVKSIDGYNAKSSSVYIKLYDISSAPTVGTSTVRKTILVPALTRFTLDWPGGIAFGTGVSIAITGAAADADTTAIASGDILVLNVDYI